MQKNKGLVVLFYTRNLHEYTQKNWFCASYTIVCVILDPPKAQKQPEVYIFNDTAEYLKWFVNLQSTIKCLDLGLCLRKASKRGIEVTT